jgi:hypothetical protein
MTGKCAKTKTASTKQPAKATAQSSSSMKTTKQVKGKEIAGAGLGVNKKLDAYHNNVAKAEKALIHYAWINITKCSLLFRKYNP